jgi:dTDP-4-amino-4,6-dideoxygalactose transaminase
MAKLAICGGEKAVTGKPATDKIIAQMTKEMVALTSELVRKREISGGSATVRNMEQEWAKFLGVKYCLAQNNGTSTLFAAFFAAIEKPGDEIITPVHTWHLGVTPIIVAGGVPVFCDIDPLTMCIDPAKIEDAITARTRAIAVTHIYGHPADMDPIIRIAKKYKLAIVEDASHAHGAEYKGRKIGALGDLGCFSLQGSKLMTGGEAGFISTNNIRYYEQVVMLGHYEYMSDMTLPEYHRYKAGPDVPYLSLGYKFRAHPLAIALAKIEFEHLEYRNALQMKNCAYLNRGLDEIEGFAGPYIAPYATKLAWLNYLVRLEPDYFDGIPREKIMAALQAEGMQTWSGRAGYIPLHLHPLMQEYCAGKRNTLWKRTNPGRKIRYRKGDFPVAERVGYERIMISAFRDVVFDTRLLDQYLDAFRKVSKYRDELRQR